jgi:3-deoxy-D-manno-octulosonate 8-phosphate phosphatase (KDO 8-P phosphatase)
MLEQEVRKYRMNEALKEKALKIKLLLTDCDGVLTDGCVYYSERGEELKKFSLRDGMGVERLRVLRHIETAIITRENSEIVKRRSEKLKMKSYYGGVREKGEKLAAILAEHSLTAEQVAYIGDDMNDKEIMQAAGFCACPADAFEEIKSISHYVCKNPGGAGAFREFAELIIGLTQP